MIGYRPTKLGDNAPVYYPEHSIVTHMSSLFGCLWAILDSPSGGDWLRKQNISEEEVAKFKKIILDYIELLATKKSPESSEEAFLKAGAPGFNDEFAPKFFTILGLFGSTVLAFFHNGIVSAGNEGPYLIHDLVAFWNHKINPE